MKKQTKNQRIAVLERQLKEALAGQTHRLRFAEMNINRANINKVKGSGIILELSFLGGQEVFAPVLIRDGLSDETIKALKGDFDRSFTLE